MIIVNYKSFNPNVTGANLVLNENVEALANGESPGNTRHYPCVIKISSNSSYGREYVERYCGDCKEHTITKSWGDDNCSL